MSFNFFKLKLKGSRIEERILPLSDRDLGIKYKRISARISGRYKILEEQQIEGLDNIDIKLTAIRNRFLSNVKDYGSVIDYSKKEEFKKPWEKS